MQLLAPPKLYLPRAQMLAWVFDALDAAGQAYPGAQSPEHVATATPSVPPNLPAGQSVQLPAAVVDEYRPTAHSVHDPVSQNATEVEVSRLTHNQTTFACPCRAFGNKEHRCPHPPNRATYLQALQNTDPRGSLSMMSPRPPQIGPPHTWPRDG